MFTFAFVLRILFVALVALIVGALIANRKKVGAAAGRVGAFKDEVMIEMKRVAWPTREEIVNSTLLVGVGTAALTVIIASVDKVFGWVIQGIFS